MPRIARVVIPDFPHHITQRGNRNQRTFFSDDDKRFYLYLLKEQLKKVPIKIWSYCLMDNHVHFVAVPQKSEDLALFFGEVHQKYSFMINKREGWRGYLWQGRFSSFVMDEPYLYSAMRYVEQNPVKAGIVEKAADYDWSSAKAHVLKTKNTILSPCYLTDEIHNWAQYLAEMNDNKQDLEIESHSRRGIPLGNEKFLDKIGPLIDKKLTYRPQGRPNKIK